MRNRTKKRLNDLGITMIEVLVAASILVIMSTSLITVRKFMAMQSVNTKDRSFANQKALQMMEELRALVAANENQDVSVLDDYHSGNYTNPANFSPILTTELSVTAPDNPLSENRVHNPGWRFVRHIDVRPPPSQPDTNLRQVTVRVYRTYDLKYTDGEQPMAQVTAILRTITSPLPPHQVYDVYFIEPFTIPGWWVNVGELAGVEDGTGSSSGIVSDMVSDIEGRNPGFKVNKHFITRMAYGRDREYAPVVNGGTGWNINNTRMPYIYFYPGRLLVDGNLQKSFYHSSLFDSDGAQYTYCDNSVTQLRNNTTTAATDKIFYPIADQFNHAVRYPEEERLYQIALARSQAAYPRNKEKWVQPSMRMLLEKMNADPNSLKNALYINLGGEMQPIPPMRNYSDAAKWPDGSQSQVGVGGVTYTFGGSPVTVPGTGVSAVYDQVYSLRDCRVVTHPEYLKATSGSVSLRVYPYMFNPDNYDDDANMPVVTVSMPNDSLGSVTVYKIIGHAGLRYQQVTAVAGVDYEVFAVGDGTQIRLYNTPMRHGPFRISSGGVSYQGVTVAGRLDGFEYMPCPLGGNAAPYTLFTDRNLSTPVTSGTAGSGVRNTARWVIALSGLSTSATDNPHVIETRLGGTENWTPGSNLVTVGGLTTFAEGETENLQNLSRTYVWCNVDPPATEQYQFMGDPRHCPYADVKADQRYNWFFRSPPTTGTTAVRGFEMAVTYGNNGWLGNANRGQSWDFPNAAKLFREGFLKSQALWATTAGYSLWIYGMGGEIGAEPQTPYTGGITMIRTPWDPTSNTAARIHEIGYGGDFINNRVVTRTDNSWSARYWLGELFPDTHYASHWRKGSGGVVGNGGGNLPTGNGNFYRALFNANAVLNRELCSYFGSAGPVQFFNSGPTAGASTWFRPNNDSLGRRVGLGTNLSALFNYPMPITFSTGATRPYRIDDNTNAPNVWSETDVVNQRVVGTVPSVGGLDRIYYEPSTGLSSATYDLAGVVRFKKTLSGTDYTYYLCNNGLMVTGNAGAQLQTRMALISLVRTFFDAGKIGATGSPDHITQLPMADIDKPEYGEVIDPGAGPTTLTWTVGYSKWDGKPYTEEYTGPHTEPTTMRYGIKFDVGTNGWQWLQDGVLTYEGEMPTGSRVVTMATAPMTIRVPINLNSPVSFTDGKIKMRLEGYREGYPLHYFWDQAEFTVQR